MGKAVEHQSYTNAGSATVSNACSLVKVSTIPSGYVDSDRKGSQVNLQSFEMRYDLVVGDTYNNFRVIVFRWYQDDGSIAPTLGDIIDDTGGAGYRYLAPYNHQQRSKYHIMYDSSSLLANTLSFNSTGSVQSTSNQSSWVESVKLKHFKVVGKKLGRKTINFDGSTTTGLGHIYVLWISDSNVVPNPGYNYVSRIMYTDA